MKQWNGHEQPHRDNHQHHAANAAQKAFLDFGSCLHINHTHRATGRVPQRHDQTEVLRVKTGWRRGVRDLAGGIGANVSGKYLASAVKRPGQHVGVGLQKTDGLTPFVGVAEIHRRRSGIGDELGRGFE